MATPVKNPRRPRALPDLAAIRRAKGISLRQISDDTKIGTRYLEAIEASQFGQLPGGLFSTSYIRQYARAIDFDEWELLASYDSTLPVEPSEPPRHPSLLSSFLSKPLRLLVPAKRT
jgi:cytoskeleton protein RodZ